MKRQTISRLIYGGFVVMTIGVVSLLGYLVFTTDAGSSIEPTDLRQPETNDMRISASGNSEFIVWRSNNNLNYRSYVGKFTGGETIESFGRGKYSIVEVSEKYYNRKLTLNREISSVSNPDIIEIADQKNITAQETNRVNESSIDLVGGEQEVELDIEVGKGNFRLSEILFYGAEVEVQNFETEHRGLRFVDGYEIPAYEVLELQNEQLVDDSITIELKVEKTNRFTGDKLYLAFNDIVYKGDTSGAEKTHEGGLGYNQTDWEAQLE